MPDILGRYTLLEMRERVRRCIDAIRVTVLTDAQPPGPTQQGDELVGGLVIDPLFSNQDINFFINSAVTMTFMDMNTGNEETFEDEQTIDVTADIMEYSLPDDICQLRSAWWKRPGLAYTIVPRQRRSFMHNVDEPGHLLREVDDGHTPTYRVQLNFIVLNEPERVKRDNPQGILVVYVKWANFLDLDDAVLETQFARVMQEVVIRRASIELIEKRTKLDASSLRTDLGEWTDRLMMTVRNFKNPSSINMVVRHPRLRRGHVRVIG